MNLNTKVWCFGKKVLSYLLTILTVHIEEHLLIAPQTRRDLWRKSMLVNSNLKVLFLSAKLTENFEVPHLVKSYSSTKNN